MRQKAESLIKIWTKFLDMVTKRQIEETTVYPLFSLFIKFSAIEIRWVFSHAKLTISWLQWLEKKVGCPCSLVSYSHFQLTAQYQGKSAMFFNARAPARANDAINHAQLGCATQNRGMTLNRSSKMQNVYYISVILWENCRYKYVNPFNTKDTPN